MKKTIATFLILSFSAGIFAQQNNSDIQKATALLKQMTLEEKVGQMTQVTMAVFAKDGWANLDGTIDPALLKKAIVDYKVGSMLNTTAHALSVDVWRKTITQIQDETKNTRVKIGLQFIF